MDAWLGMPGWRLARLAMMPFSKKCKHEFMRNSIFYIFKQNEPLNTCIVLVIYIFIIDFMFTLFLQNVYFCIFLGVVGGCISSYCALQIHKQGAGQMPELYPDDANPVMREVALFHVHTRQQWN